MLTVVTWKWSRPGYRSNFTAEHVNVLRRMVARHYPAPHKFVCVTDDAAGLERDIHWVPFCKEANKLLRIPSPLGGNNPACYVRLLAFDRSWCREHLGERVVSLDLDTVIVGDMTPVWDRPDPFIIWGDTAAWAKTWYNGSMFMLSAAGVRQNVYTTFDPKSSPRRAHAAGCRGSDQGWISFCLGPTEKRWTSKDGVYSWRVHLKPGGGKLPDNARIVFFHGLEDPWHDAMQKRYPWISENWR